MWHPRLMDGAADRYHGPRECGRTAGASEDARTRLVGLDFGAEPSRRAGGQPGRGPAGGQVLQPQGQRAGSRPETEHDGHLHYARRGPRCHDAPDPGPLTRGEALAEQSDPRPHVFGRPRGELSRRTGAGQDFHDHLGELPGPRDGRIRAVGGGACAERQRRPGWLGASLRPRRFPARGSARAGDGYLARRRACAPVHLTVVGRPAARNLDQSQPAEGTRRRRRQGRRRHGRWSVRRIGMSIGMRIGRRIG